MNGLKTDSLFYYLFQTAPGILFELLGQPAELAEGYEFRSVELKQTAFRIDGVLLPRVSATDSTVFFVEIQFQLDPYFYHRFFAEIFLFLRQNPEMKDWHAVVLFAKRGIEPGQTQPFQPLLESELVSRIFLEDLQENASNSLGIGLVRLVAARPNAAVDLAKVLLGQAREVDSPLFSPAAIIDLIETVVVYKFPQLSREDIEKMLGLSEIKKTRVYQEALEEGRQEGRQAGECDLVLRLLNRRFGQIAPDLEAKIRALSLPELEELGEALLDFSDRSDLTNWLQ